MRKLILAVTLLLPGLAMASSAFPWCLAAPTGSFLGISGQENPRQLGGLVTTATITTANGSVTQQHTQSRYDVSLSAIPRYLLDGTSSIVSSNPSAAPISGTTLTSAYYAFNPYSSSFGLLTYAFNPQELYSNSLAMSAVANSVTVTATGTAPQPPSGIVNTYVSGSVPVYDAVVNTLVSWNWISGDLGYASRAATQSMASAASTAFVNYPNGVIPSGSTPDFLGSAYPFSPYFSWGNGETSVTINSSCWLRTNGIDFTGRDWFAGTGSPIGDATPKTLVTPYHVIFCNHTYPYSLVTATYLFIDNSGNFVTSGALVRDEQVLTNGTTVPPPFQPAGTQYGTNVYYTDVRIGTLASAMSASIRPIKLAPPYWAWKYLSYGAMLQNSNSVPVISLLSINGPLIALSGISGWGYGLDGVGIGYGDSRAPFYSSPVSGDSGSPACLYNPAANELALIGVYAFPSETTDVTDYVAALNNYLWHDYLSGNTSTCYQFGSSTTYGANPWGGGTVPSSITYVPFSDFSSFTQYN